MRSVRFPVFLTAMVALLCVALAFGVIARRSTAADALWQTDFKAAQAKAKQEKKYLLVDFTGSDWCGYCIKLHNDVFDKAPFQAEAPKQFVLVELDFPHQKEQSDELKKQNKDLSEKYKVDGFPTVLMMDAEGEVIARRTGYGGDSNPDEYLKQLADFSKTYQDLLVLKTKLDKTQGLDRAKLLDQIVEGYEKLDSEAEKVAAWSKEIIALDPDNKAGLKVKYEFPLTLAEARDLLRNGKTAEAKDVLDKALALQGVPGEMRQEGYMLKVEIPFSEKKFVEVVATLKAAKEAAPKSENVKQIDAAIEQYGKVADAQETSDKLEAGLPKSEGMDRAKLLDKLVEAKLTLVRIDPEAGENIPKWTKEIIALDPDNKAGLKKKYQFKAALADAIELMQADKVDEANTMIDKAMAAGGVSGEDVQMGHLMQAANSVATTQ